MIELDLQTEQYTNEAKIERTRLFLIINIMVMSIVVIALFLSGKQKGPTPTVTDIALCDRNPRELCIVTFGASDPGLMAINFQLPQEDYPLFHVTGLSRGISHQYSCYTEETVPTSVYCTGPRTSLGEYIELEVYTVEGNIPLARGKIFVAAVMVWTPGSIITTSLTSETPAVPDATGTESAIPFFTPLTETVSPTPDQGFMTPFPATAYPNP
jgi:hypothetical protein